MDPKLFSCLDSNINSSNYLVSTDEKYSLNITINYKENDINELNIILSNDKLDILIE